MTAKAAEPPVAPEDAKRDSESPSARTHGSECAALLRQNVFL